MKKILAFICCSFIISGYLHAQQPHPTPQLLKGPANWEFERFPLPPSFAPSIHYKGAEELRFSPGMFDKTSPNYFTYAFVAELENVTNISKEDISNYLVNYFKGLCSSTAKERKLTIDTSKITVVVEKKKHEGNEAFYEATLNIFGVFADGAPVKLNMEIKALYNKATSKAYLVFIGSPQDKTNKIWNELRAIQQGFKI